MTHRDKAALGLCLLAVGTGRAPTPCSQVMFLPPHLLGLGGQRLLQEGLPQEVQVIQTTACWQGRLRCGLTVHARGRSRGWLFCAVGGLLGIQMMQVGGAALPCSPSPPCGDIWGRSSNGDNISAQPCPSFQGHRLAGPHLGFCSRIYHFPGTSKSLKNKGIGNPVSTPGRCTWRTDSHLHPPPWDGCPKALSPPLPSLAPQAACQSCPGPGGQVRLVPGPSYLETVPSSTIQAWA